MTRTVAAVMTTTEGAPVPLTDVNVRAVLRDLLAEVTVEHSYRNEEAAPIEAVYSFPLPPEAVLMDVQVTLGERRLTGRVVGRQDAEREYEEAVLEGDAAVMIERPEPGLYVMNLGNLLPQAEARVTFRYALVLRRQRGRIRFLHPTTIAPRYGRWALQPHQVPQSTLLARQSGTMEVEIAGVLADAVVRSPSHEVDIDRGTGRTVVRLRRGRMDLDRDFILELDASGRSLASTQVGADVDGGYACLLTVEPRLPAEADAAPRDLKIVIDCSGSMQGDSIAQARAALSGILERLRPQDRFTVIQFGSVRRTLFHVMVPGDDVTIAAAQRVLANMAADMGGTEMGTALAEAYGVPVREGAVPTVVLITDGEIADASTVARAARSSGHRLFTIGVGSAVAEGLLRDLAHQTGGACELVSPREDMAERIIRHVRRIDGGGASLTVQWPAQPLAVFDLEQPVFPGDTAVLFARFARRPQGEAVVAATCPARPSVEERVTFATRHDDEVLSTIARLAAARELFALGMAIDSVAEAERTDLVRVARDCAERYQLLSPWTNWLMVAAQANAKAGEIPALRRVPHMLAAGWGGSGTMMQTRNLLAHPATARAPAALHDQVYPAHANRAFEIGTPLLDVSAEMPKFLRRSAGRSDGLDVLINRLDGHGANRGGQLRRLLGPKSTVPDIGIDDLLSIDDIAPETIAELRRLVAEGHDERAVVAAFLQLLIDGPMRERFGRRGRLLVRQLHRDLAPQRDVTDAVRKITSGSIAPVG